MERGSNRRREATPSRLPAAHTGAALLAAAMLGGPSACNALWGIDELSYDGGQHTVGGGGAGGAPPEPCNEPGTTRPCYDGSAATRGIGACRDGSSTCTGDSEAAWGPCTGQVLPIAEVCNNGADDDCDGELDEAAGCCDEQSCAAQCQGSGEASGHCGATGCECCTPSCSGKCAGADDGCGGTCTQPCAADECCNASAQCVPGGTDAQCGHDGASCAQCADSGRSCGPAGPQLTNVAQTCLPPCTGHLQAVSVSTGALGGTAAASVLCTQALGPDWHLLDSFTTAVGVAHGGSDIAGICHGDWCTDIVWNGVGMIMAASSCGGLTLGTTGQAEGIGTEVECFIWGAGQCDCGTLAPCGALDLSHGVLCTDW